MKSPNIQFTSENKAELQHDFTVEVKHCFITCKKGFITDGVSLPPFIIFLVILFGTLLLTKSLITALVLLFLWSWSGSPFQGDTLTGALFHDLLYQTKSFKRYEADYIFYELMREHNTNIIRRVLYYLSVRLFGWIYYPKKSKGNEYIIIKNK
jgi:hypothetical protein